MIFIPSKIFPCNCMGEGLTITPLTDDEDISEGEVLMSEDKRRRDCIEAPFIQLSFWEFGVCKKSRWNWWWRLKIGWRVFREGSAWPDQVIMKAAHAKNFANHLLYMISKAQKEIKLAEKQESLQPIEELVKNRNSNFCQEHGGTPAGEIISIRNEVDCPKCTQLTDLGIDEQGKKLIEKPHPMYCVQHGGSVAGEKVNNEHGFGCPRCAANLELLR